MRQVWTWEHLCKDGVFLRRQLCKTGVNEARIMGFCSPNTNFLLKSVGGKGVSIFVRMGVWPLLEHNGDPRGSIYEWVDYLHLA